MVSSECDRGLPAPGRGPADDAEGLAPADHANGLGAAWVIRALLEIKHFRIRRGAPWWPQADHHAGRGDGGAAEAGAR
jgi:hypothetical protein